MLRPCSLIILVCLVTVGISSAEFQLNTYTDSEQTTPSIASDSGGNFIVVWASKYQDGDWRGIYGQRFDSYGIRIGDEFQINVTTEGNQGGPDVAMNTTGNFVVVWQGEDGSDEGIYGRQYDANGQPLTSEFLVNTSTDSRQLEPKAAMNDEGSFVIVWEDSNSVDGHAARWQVCGQLYNSEGIPQGQEFIISQLPHGLDPDVAMNQTGEFIVVFHRYGDSPHPPTGYHLRIRRYNANGTPKGNEEPLTEDIKGFSRPSISMNKTGDYVVVWTLNQADIYAQLFDSNDNTIGNSLLVNTSMGGTRSEPEISIHDDGQFVAVWSGRADQDYVFGRFYNSGGIPDGNEFRLNDYTVGDQRWPVVLMQPSGRFIAAWQSDGPDGSEEGVFATFRPETFAGDFTGNGKVDFPDLALLANRWLDDEPVLDIAPPDSADGIVSFLDFACFSTDWLQMQPWYTPLAGINGDGIVNFEYFTILAGQWLQEPGVPSADIAPLPGGDNVVNALDFLMLTSQWLETGSSYIP
jgi:hypothetical protein